MKLGRNDPCSCGSGKKFKRCCMDNVSKQQAAVLDDFSNILAMNPNLTEDELNIAIEHKMDERNNKPDAAFCGLSPTQMFNWLYAPFNELTDITINTPDDLASCPVICYLEVILNEAMQNDGSFKSTKTGNLPVKIVKQANALLPQFAVAKFNTPESISPYAGLNEDKFDALHYTRILAEIAGLIYRRSGSYHIKKSVQKTYQKEGVQAFFKPMLEAATSKYNWGYFDGWDQDIDLKTFWVFMLWRLQNHACVNQLLKEVNTAFPDLLSELPSYGYFTGEQLLSILIKTRFIDRFLQFWGFVLMDPKQGFNGENTPQKVEVQPLLTQTFKFSV
jgi:hypothetical protein